MQGFRFTIFLEPQNFFWALFETYCLSYFITTRITFTCIALLFNKCQCKTFVKQRDAGRKSFWDKTRTTTNMFTRSELRMTGQAEMGETFSVSNNLRTNMLIGKWFTVWPAYVARAQLSSSNSQPLTHPLLQLTVFVCPQVVILFLSRQVIYHSFPWLITSCFCLKITSVVSKAVVQRGFFSWVFCSMDLRWSTHQAKSVAKATVQMFGTFGNSNIWNK